jgi:hypothetical protein
MEAIDDAMEAAKAGSTHTGLPPSPVTHVGPAPARPVASSPRLGAGTPPPVPVAAPSGNTLPYERVDRIEDSVEIEIDVELEQPAAADVDFTEPTERVEVETIDVDHLDPIETSDPGARPSMRQRWPRTTNAGMGGGSIDREVTRLGMGNRVARHLEKRPAQPTPAPAVRAAQPALAELAEIRSDGDATVPYPKSVVDELEPPKVPESLRTLDEDPATVKFTRPYERFEIDLVRESETPHVVRELAAPKNLVHETQGFVKREPVSAPYETLEIAPLRHSSTAQMLRQCQRRRNPIWRWAIAGLILGAGAFACGLSLAHLILR